MKNRVIIYILALLWSGSAMAQSDSLAHYLETAARNNPLVNSDYLLYKASLEKIPQAGAIPDPQLEMGFFLQPMEVIDGKQIADFKLMQMFPWFGTTRAARNEATEMSRMSYEKFRETRDNLFMEVKTQWYALANLQQQLTNVRENKVLLSALRDLAINRFSAPSFSATTNTSYQSKSVTTTASQPATQSSAGMSGMGQTAGAPSQVMSGSQGQGMSQMSSGGMGASQGGMSDVLRIDIELNELEETQQALLSQIISAKAKFNALLNRAPQSPVVVADTIVQRLFPLDDESMMGIIKNQNPMLRMANAEADAYKAKAEMDKKMGLPMIGIGLQYSVIGKRTAMGMPTSDMAMGIPTTDMNGKDMIMPMVSVSIPIWRKKYRAAVNESRLMSRAAEQKYENTLNMLGSEYVSMREQLADAQRKTALYRKQEELALATYQLAVREFSIGANTMSSVLEIERQLLDYKFKRSESVATYNTVVAAIENLLSDNQNEYEK